MHTATFYSFKGGVGRTLALVNVGVELANSGRKVLLVDFDLEAPGVDTFEELKAPKDQVGVVDFVCEFCRSGSPPNFSDYHYRAPLATKGNGELWIMPAGCRNSQYGTKLASIDWQRLYREMDGYLFLEDLKAQWLEQLNPDYVLVDSRTGHSEVGGICTRQIPDTVAVFFMPNEQNLSGLSGVVESIKSEAKRSGRKSINLEFIASNVPSLDDEEEILKGLMRKFAKTLGFAKALSIDRYDSLQLLNQSVFVLNRPRSRLAKQYRRLLQQIVEHNLDDRDAALRVVSRQFRHPDSFLRIKRTDSTDLTISDRLDEILARHSEDPEILFTVGQLKKRQGKAQQSALLFEKAAQIAAERNDAAASRYLLEAIDSRISEGKKENVEADIGECLRSEYLGIDNVCRAISMLQSIDAKPLVELPHLPSVMNANAEALAEIASKTHFSREWQRIGFELLFREDANSKNRRENSQWRNEAMLASIGLGQFDVAESLADQKRVELNEADIADYFNLAMTRWGETKQVPIDLFLKVVELDSKSTDAPDDPNFEQCLALANYFAGNIDIAQRRLAESRRMIVEIPFSRFSCWSYLLLEPSEFAQDLTLMAQFFDGKQLVPKFFPE